MNRADSTRGARIRRAAPAALLACAEALVASQVFTVHETSHSAGSDVVRGIAFASPTWWLDTARFVYVPLLLLVRRAWSHRRGPPTSVPLQILVASLVCVAPLVNRTPWPFFSMIDVRVVATMVFAQGATVVTIACAFDLFAAAPRPRAHAVLAIALLGTLVTVHRSAAVTGLIASMAGEPYFVARGLVGLGALVGFAAFSLARSRDRSGLDEGERRSIEAFVIGLGATLLHAFTAFVYTSPYFAFTRVAHLAWFVPTGLATLVLVFAPALRRDTMRVLVVWLVCWTCLVLVDRAMPVQPMWHAPDEHVAYAFVGDFSRLRVVRAGRIEDVANDVETPATVSWSVGDRAHEGHAERCVRDRVEYQSRAWVVLHPHEEVPRTAGLFVHRDASDDDLASCVEALADSGLTTVDFFGPVRAPLPRWSTVHRLAFVYRPHVRVLSMPVSMLRCDAIDAARCSARGVVRLQALVRLANEPTAGGVSSRR